jgi:Fe-S oxidoreductase
MKKSYADLEKLKNEMLTCTMCGFCKNVCPVFLDAGWDTGSPRGRMTMAYGLVSGELELDDDLVNRIFQCTQCRDCSRRCPSSVKCPEVVLSARRELVSRGLAGETQKAIAENIAKTGNIFADLEVEFPEQEGDVPLFIGCQHLSRPNSTKRNIRLLQRLGINPRIVKEVCCGFPLEVMGFEEEHEKQVEKLKESFSFKEEPILTFCPGCKVHLEKISGKKVLHILEEINTRLKEDQIAKPMKAKVTYHDPCDLSRGAGIVNEPREILKKLGCEIIEMKNAKNTSRCCGGGGGILTWDDALSLRMSVARMKEAIGTGAEMVVTACPTCEQTLKKGALQISGENGSKPFPVAHILDLLFKATK